MDVLIRHFEQKKRQHSFLEADRLEETDVLHHIPEFFGFQSNKELARNTREQCGLGITHEEHEVATFERQHKIVLPYDFRKYITQVSAEVFASQEPRFVSLELKHTSDLHGANCRIHGYDVCSCDEKEKLINPEDGILCIGYDGWYRGTYWLVIQTVANREEYLGTVWTNGDTLEEWRCVADNFSQFLRSQNEVVSEAIDKLSTPD